MNDILQKLEEVSNRIQDRTVIDPEMFAKIIDALPDGLLVIDDAGVIQIANQQTELLFGYPRSMLLGNPVHMLLPEELRAAHAQYVRKYFSHPSVRPMNMAQTLSGLHRNGTQIAVQISLGPVVSIQGVWALALVRRVGSGG
jgi:PAS domain S-box-containing protein